MPDALFPFPTSLPLDRIIAGEIRMAVTMAGEGRPVVLIHGLGWDRNLWRPQVERLSQRYRVIAADTRGHGESDKPDGPYSIDQYAADWAALLDALGVTGACVVGFSQGGMTAQILAAKRPDLVSALCLVSTSGKFQEAGRANMEKRLAAQAAEGAEAAAKVAADSVFSESWRAAHPDELARFVDWRAGHDQPALAHAMRAGYGFDATVHHAGLAMPVLVLAGTADTLTPPAGMRVIAAAIPSAAYAEIPGAGHMIPIEQPAAFDAALDGFLDKHHPAAG
jgi:3-oxoadipate enol-lactonase